MRKKASTQYADDTYVTLNGTTDVELKDKIERCLSQHERYMEGIGMVINKQKTELINFSKADPTILCLENGIQSSKDIKALGVTISHNLKWEKHISNVICKTSKTINSIRFLRRYITNEDALKITTSKYFGQSYYAASVWLNNNLSYNLWERLDRQHYRAIRAAIGDYKKKVPRSVLNIISKRATPKEWANYSSASTAIALYNQNNTRIGTELRNHGYINDRKPHRAIFPDVSKRMLGRHSFKNRLQQMSMLNFDWIQESSKDVIRMRLKRTFFAYGLH